MSMISSLLLQMKAFVMDDRIDHMSKVRDYILMPLDFINSVRKVVLIIAFVRVNDSRHSRKNKKNSNFRQNMMDTVGIFLSKRDGIV
jgi:hypothetical protein